MADLSSSSEGWQLKESTLLSKKSDAQSLFEAATLHPKAHGLFSPSICGGPRAVNLAVRLGIQHSCGHSENDLEQTVRPVAGGACTEAKIHDG